MLHKATFIICFFWLCSLSIRAQTREVCPSCEYTTIKSAVAAAQSGETVRIHTGLYQEGNILIDKSIHLIGTGKPILDGQNETEILTIIANGVVVEGLTLRNVGTSYIEDRAAIRIRRAKNFIIRNNFLEDTFFGVYLEHAAKGEIYCNQIQSHATTEAASGNAIHLWYSKHILVEDNYVSGHRDGIYFEFVDSSQVFRNVSENNLRYGLHFMFSNYDSYTGNTFRNNGAGVAVMFSKQIQMKQNTFAHNWGRAAYGLLLKEIYDADIHGNLFQENTVAIYVEGSTRIQYRSNTFSQNGWAIKMSGGCLDNAVVGNNFLSNTFDMTLASKANNNTFDGNYWSEYSGYDLDKDGMGDIPFRPVKLFSYIVDQTPESIVLLRSLFVDIINFSEKVSPVFTPQNILDTQPLMTPLSIPSYKRH